MTAAFSPEGSRVLTTTGVPTRSARLWKTETGELERELTWNGNWPMGAVFSPDGTKVATRAQLADIQIFDAASGNSVRTLPNGGWGGGMAFSPAAPLLAAGSAEFTAELYNYETGQRLHTFSENAGSVTSVAFSANGDTLMIGWVDGLVHLYNTATLELRREILVRTAFLEAAAFSPDGRFILTGEGWPFFTATLWDAKMAEPLRTFAGHKWAVSAVAFSADGKSVLTGAEIVREWSIADVAVDLRIERLPTEMKLTWAYGDLQHATGVNGPWVTMTNAVSPLAIPLADGAGFFRVQTAESN
jgi:WD40 repeat protein